MESESPPQSRAERERLESFVGTVLKSPKLLQSGRREDVIRMLIDMHDDGRLSEQEATFLSVLYKKGQTFDSAARTIGREGALGIELFRRTVGTIREEMLVRAERVGVSPEKYWLVTDE